MGRGHEVDVVATLFLEAEHYGSQFGWFHGQPDDVMADFEVLAEGAKEIAGTEKNRAGAVQPHQRRLFAEMGGIAGNNGLVPCSADPRFTGQPVDAAVARAEPAGGRNQGKRRSIRSCSFPPDRDEDRMVHSFT
jgi:hypothetical protein